MISGRSVRKGTAVGDLIANREYFNTPTSVGKLCCMKENKKDSLNPFMMIKWLNK